MEDVVEKGKLVHPFLIKESVWAQMVTHCSQQLPIEACGLLSGKNEKADTIWVMDNVLRSATAFEMDLVQQEHVFNAFQGMGEELVGIYHSHPTASPYPSPIDIANANYPDVVYLIVSFAKRSPEVGCFWIRDNQVIPLSYRLF